MNKKEFVNIRYSLGKTQMQMAQMLGLSLKAIQSFEQGWRKIPIHTERQSLFLLALKGSRIQANRPCWTIKKCCGGDKENCPAWQLHAGQFCWLINGTICQGKVQKSWTQKMKICRKCEIFKSLLTLAGAE